jgi:hypothetical protein
MTTDALTAAGGHTTTRAQRRLGVLVAAIVFALALAAVVGIRTVMANQEATAQAQAAAAIRSFPTNPTLETTWGIRFTAVNVLADGGVVEVRYTVLDPNKAARIHSGKLTDLPYIRATDTGKEVHSYSLMFHVHFDHTPTDADGRSYSIVFGNSDGAARIGGTVSLILPDGLRLDRVPVS